MAVETDLTSNNQRFGFSIPLLAFYISISDGSAFFSMCPEAFKDEDLPRVLHFSQIKPSVKRSISGLQIGRTKLFLTLLGENKYYSKCI